MEEYLSVFSVIERGGREKDEPDKRKDLMLEELNTLLTRSMLYWHFSLSSPQYVLDDPDESII
jgi:hypothetical protein